MPFHDRCHSYAGKCPGQRIPKASRRLLSPPPHSSPSSQSSAGLPQYDFQAAARAVRRRAGALSPGSVLNGDASTTLFYNCETARDDSPHVKCAELSNQWSCGGGANYGGSCEETTAPTDCPPGPAPSKAPSNAPTKGSCADQSMDCGGCDCAPIPCPRYPANSLWFYPTIPFPDTCQAGQAYRSSNTRAFETFVFPAFYTRACRVPDTHQ